MNLILGVVRSLTTQVREINAKYAKPNIEMTLFVKLNLLFLRFYLLVLVGLLVYRFIAVVKQ
ncbi:MAG TPA: hypothetical protein VE398_21180 [Acidobacteriota bacterium]|nr:hypothetical protein [Acidobacteriota bacterium]